MPFLSPQDFVNMVRLNLRTAVKTPLIGIDLGRKFVGLSLSDEKANQAFILDGFVSTESSILFDAKFRTFLQQKMVENKAKGLVIGFPFEDGAYNSLFDRMIETLSLMKDFDYPITKHDERCTTMASRKISHEIDKMHKFKHPSLAKDKLFNDKVAATLILQDFCDEIHRRKK